VTARFTVLEVHAALVTVCPVVVVEVTEQVMEVSLPFLTTVAVMVSAPLQLDAQVPAT